MTMLDAHEMRRMLMDRRGILLRRWHESERDEDDLLAERVAEREELATDQALAKALDEHREADLRSLQEIAAAIVRLDSETYGTCMDCSESIAAARLRAYPETRYCNPCAEARETEASERR